VRINGEHIQITSMTLSSVISMKCYDKDRIAVELNGSIVPRKDYETTEIRDNDILEIVCFVGGG
jgi:thiamine biosynthesis protein ThiS